MFGHADGTHPGAAAAVENTKGFVQIQVRDIAAEFAGRGQAHQRVHIGAVDIDLPAHIVHGGTEFGNALFKHAVGGGVGDHNAGDAGAELGDFFVEIGQVHVAFAVTVRHHHFHAHHLRRGGVGAVGRGGNQADIALEFALAFKV